MKIGLKIFILLIIVGGVGFFSYQAGVLVGQEKILRTPPTQIINSQPEELLENKIDFSIFWETWRKLERDFLDKEKIDYQKMVYGAIKGMIETIEDPYTTFFNPQETNEFEEELSGKYQGVGMEVGIRDNKITVISPLEGTPAEKAGIKPGDIILKIDDVSSENLSLEKAVSKIRGEHGTAVELLIGREAWQAPQVIILKREIIKIPTLKLEIKKTLSGTPVAYLKIYQFNKILDNEFSQAAAQIISSPAKKIILDLRNNPGGYLDVACDVAGWFLDRGKIIVIQDEGPAKEKKEYKSSGPAKFKEYPMVVLINEGSASGAEILAGALRDINNVKLIGKKSFGKGSVQEQIGLKSGSSLKITIAKWFTPNGYSINEEGLAPDIEVLLNDEDWDKGKDPQLDKALEIIENL